MTGGGGNGEVVLSQKGVCYVFHSTEKDGIFFPVFTSLRGG